MNTTNITCRVGHCDDFRPWNAFFTVKMMYLKVYTWGVSLRAILTEEKKMNEFPNSPPKSNAEKRRDKKGSPVKAITIGVIVDIGGTIILGLILVMIYSVLLASEGLSPEEIEHQLINLDPHSTFSIIGMILGGLMTVVAGYLCASIVNYSEYKFTFILGSISAASGLMVGESQYSTLDNIFLSILTVMCALLGAWLYVVGKANRTDDI